MVLSAFHQHKHQQQRQRRLEDNNSYLVDSDGKAYKSYSLAWRYLGLFIDCSDDDEDDDRRRHRRRHLSDSGDDGGTCTRKVLWAAYHYGDYAGRSIGEYQFFDRSTNRWDSSTCRPTSIWNPFHAGCQRMDCHEAGTNFELVGVFTETDGLYDWTEQLFKHQGYCLWDGDKDDDENGNENENENENQYSDYNFMQSLQEKLTYGCAQLDDYYDDDGSALYVDIKPQSFGDMTLGVYTDASCSIESSLTWFDVHGNDDDDEDDDDNISSDAIDRWNDLMGDYKICQPCRAYNRVVTNEVESNDSGSGDDSGCYDQSDSNDRSGSNSYDEGEGKYHVISRMYQIFYHFLTGHWTCRNNEEYSESYDYEEEEEEEEDNDGEGSNEQWGFDCNDDAGYLNCNQCYKFQTKTDLALASIDDLELATEQGTILAISVDGIQYGGSGHKENVLQSISLVALVSAVALAGMTVALLSYQRYRRIGNGDMKEGLTDATKNPSGDDPDVERFEDDAPPALTTLEQHKTDFSTDTISHQKKMDKLVDEYRNSLDNTGIGQKKMDELVVEYRKELDLEWHSSLNRGLGSALYEKRGRSRGRAKDKKRKKRKKRRTRRRSSGDFNRRDVFIIIAIAVFVAILIATTSLVVFITIAIAAFIAVFMAVIVATVGEYSDKEEPKQIEVKDRNSRSYDEDKEII